MRSVTLLSYCLISVLFVACSSETPQPAQEETKPMAQQSEQVPAESEPEEQPAAAAPASPAPASPAQAAPPATQPPPGLSLSPGLAKITASVVSVETKGALHICTLKIDKVHGYGSSTKPLAVGNQVRVSVKNAQIERAQAKGPALLKAGSSVDVTMRFQEPAAVITSPPPSWSVAEIH